MLTKHKNTNLRKIRMDTKNTNLIKMRCYTFFSSFFSLVILLVYCQRKKTQQTYNSNWVEQISKHIEEKNNDSATHWLNR